MSKKKQQNSKVDQCALQKRYLQDVLRVLEIKKGEYSGKRLSNESTFFPKVQTCGFEMTMERDIINFRGATHD